MSSRRLREEIARKYESDPRGWSFLWNTDERGRYNFLVAKESRFWWLKEEMINPQLTVGCGVRSSLESDLKARVFGKSNIHPSYGLRPIEENQMKLIIADLAEGKAPRTALSEVLRSEPRRLKELDTSFVMQGPFHQTTGFADILSDKQKELDAKLNTELERLIMKRYPQLTMPYT